MKLNDLPKGTKFKCPWRDDKQPIVTLVDKTLSAAWVKYVEEAEVERTNRKTKEVTLVMQKKTISEPWSLMTEVTPL